MLAPHERRALLQRIRTEISADWQTEEHPRERLTVADEREHAIFYLAEILYRIVPAFYQEIAAALGKLYGVSPETLELPVIVRFGTWVGGDMEASSRRACQEHPRDAGARAAGRSSTTITPTASSSRSCCRRARSRVGVSSAVLRRIEEYRTLVPGAPGIAPARHDRMPYRVLLGQIAERLHATHDGRASGYQQPAQFRADIALIAQSLLRQSRRARRLFPVRRLLCAHRHLRLSPGDAGSARARARCITRCWRRGWTIRPGCTRSAAERHARLVEILERDIGPTGSFDALGQAHAGGVRRHHCRAAIATAPMRSGSTSSAAWLQADDVLAPLVLARWAERLRQEQRARSRSTWRRSSTASTRSSAAARSCASCSRMASTSAIWRRAAGCRPC